MQAERNVIEPWCVPKPPEKAVDAQIRKKAQEVTRPRRGHSFGEEWIAGARWLREVLNDLFWVESDQEQLSSRYVMFDRTMHSPFIRPTWHWSAAITSPYSYNEFRCGRLTSAMQEFADKLASARGVHVLVGHAHGPTPNGFLHGHALIALSPKARFMQTSPVGTKVWGKNLNRDMIWSQEILSGVVSKHGLGRANILFRVHEESGLLIPDGYPEDHSEELYVAGHGNLDVAIGCPRPRACRRSAGCRVRVRASRRVRANT